MAAQLTSCGKACEVARGSLVAAMLVLVAMREQGSSSKLLDFEKHPEDNEVAVMEWERSRLRVIGILLWMTRGRRSS